MHPIEHMKPSDEELIAHIKQGLKEYEEPYVLGSWEKFDQSEKKTKKWTIGYWAVSGAAAVLIISVSLYLFSNNADKKPVYTIQRKSILNNLPKQSDEKNKVTPENNAQNSQTDKTAVVSGKRTRAGFVNSRAENSGEKQTEADPPVSYVQPNIAESGSISSNDFRTDVIDKKEIPKDLNDSNTALKNFLALESQENKQNKATVISAGRNNKWEMGVVVSPSIGNTKKLNMGYGVSMGYAVTNKISLNSGISYNQMAASKDLQTATTMSIASGGKNLKSVESKVEGIDIPIEIKYYLSKNIYANVGVSAFAVINQEQNNNYVQERLVSSTPAAFANSDKFNTVLVSERTIEKAPEADLNEDKYLGFYNFSFGYKQKISKTKSISVEPFMKVPMKEIAKENLRFIGTGVRLKLDF